jgi:hypothetical protein
VFEDGDFVFAHTDYDFFGPKIGFDVFRFENGRSGAPAFSPERGGRSEAPGGRTAARAHLTGQALAFCSGSAVRVSGRHTVAAELIISPTLSHAQVATQSPPGAWLPPVRQVGTQNPRHSPAGTLASQSAV